MSLSRGQNRILHVAKKQLALDDDTWRAILLNIVDVSSSTELTQARFDAVMGYLEYLGFQPRRAVGPYYGERKHSGMASPAQVQLIRNLWTAYSGATDWTALDAWIAKTFKVSSLRFVSKTCAAKVIYALRKMAERAADNARASHAR